MNHRATRSATAAPLLGLRLPGRLTAQSFEVMETTLAGVQAAFAKVAEIGMRR